MNRLKHLLIFININIDQIKRKWLSLPLLLLSPILFISLIAAIIISFFSTDEKTLIQIGLVDLDQSIETTMLTELLSDTSQLGSYLQIHHMTEDEAEQQIANNQISAYIVFPKNFTKNLYDGNSVKLEMKGNPSQPTESLAIKELLDSLSRHIRSAQANILTINEYARKLQIDRDKRQDLLFEQFVEFFVYTIGKDKVLHQNQIENIVTSSPKQYFLVSGWFILITIWTFLLNTFFYQANPLPMQQRIALYGVTRSHQLFARVIVALFISAILAISSFFLLDKILNVQLTSDNILRISLIIILYLLLLFLTYTVIEMLIDSEKFQLITQLFFTSVFMLSSGAIIPSIYFSLRMQNWLAHSFSYEAFYWIQEIIFNGRFYADYSSLFIWGLLCFVLLVAVLTIKERVRQ